MKYIKYILVFTCLIAFSVSAQQVLTVEECRSMALENNKQMSIASENRKKAEYDVKAAQTNFLPKLSATGNYLFTTINMENKVPGSYLPTFVPDANGVLNPNILTTVDGALLFKEYAYFPDMDLNLKLNGTYIAGVTLEQPIYTGGKINAAYRMSKIGAEIAGLNKMKTRTEVILQSDEAYWTYVQILELAKITRAYKELVSHLLKDVENAYNAGMKPRNDLLKVQVKLNEAELQVLQSENGVRLSRKNLCHVIGLPLDTEVVPNDNFNDPIFHDLVSADITSRPEYEILSKQIELKDQQIKLARSEFLPNVGIMGNFGYVNGLKLNDSKLLDNTSFSAVVSVSIPLFNWGEGRNKVKSATAEKNLAVLQRDELSEKMELELQQALDKINESRMEVILTEHSLKQAEENMQESKNRYNAGMETMSDHLEAQTLWQQACSEHIRAKTAAKLSETRYLKAAGKL